MSFNRIQAIHVFIILIVIITIRLSTSLQTSNTTPATSLSSCPADCQCVVLKGARLRNHAKCSSVNGLSPAIQSLTNDTSTLSIHSIDLSHLGLSRITQHLEKLRDLTNIDLSYNELSEIGRLGRRVKKLNLTHNRITSGKLSRVPKHIQHLDLSFNELTYLPLELTQLTKLQSIELNHNRINCTCQTLEVRNWLQEKHVFSEYPVTCMYPLDVKGKSWLQIRKSEMCKQEQQQQHPEIDPSENELMLGDQPFADGSGERDEEEELGRDFMPVVDGVVKSSTDEPLNDAEDTEGSGDLSLPNMSIEFQITEGPTTKKIESIQASDGEEDGSGSGMGPLIVPKIKFDNDGNEEDESNEQSSSPTDIFGNGLGIVEFDEDKSEGKEIIHSTIVPILYHETHDEVSVGEKTPDGSNEVEIDLEKASISLDDRTEDTNATYYLLGVIVLVLVGLILFVAIKRCKTQNQRSYDPENPRSTELLDMDNKNLGKPLHKNGTEHAPLIGEKKKEDFAKLVNGNGTKRSPYNNDDVKDGKAQQPLLMNGDKKAHSTPDHEESNNNVPIQPKVIEPVHAPEYYDPNHRIIPRYPPPKSPRASKYSQSGGDDSNFLPSSPRSGRYSPVYSPETGRVKIKLTETPKPKTPMLVTRSKSNAGDIITTPIKDAAVASPYLDAAGLHPHATHMSQ